jgi:transcriptional regulator with PAS, ATPase and Fis domain
MITTTRSKGLQNFGYFEVDSTGTVNYLCSEICHNFNLEKDKIIGLPIEQFFKSQLTQVSLKEIEKKPKTVFGLIGEEPSLVHITPNDRDDSSGFICQIVLLKEHINAEDVYSFGKSIDSEGKSSKKKNQNSYSHRYSFDEIIGANPLMKEVIVLASKVAKGRSTVLITGDSGTGKELFAQAIHDTSPRREGPFVAVNCSAIPETLFESELFGYEGGAFSGARREGKAGKIELAQNGTLFLDEISELPLLMQGKLLRVLQEREIERIGSTGRKLIDIRIVAASNKNLKKLVDEGKFRQDLYYRLKVFELKIPALRQRKEDILILTTHFINRYNEQFGLKVQHIDLPLKQWLLNYQWPGNVRELQAAIERGMNIVEGNTLTLEAVGFHSDLYVEEEPQYEEFLPLENEVAKAEISAISRALRKTNGDRMAAAQILNIHIASLYRKLSKYSMKEKDDWVENKFNL